MRCMTWMQPLHAEQTIDTMTETPAPYRVTPNADYHADYAPAAPPAQLPRAPLRLSCVVPAHNEEANHEDFVRALAQAAGRLTPEFEIIIVNDGSRDATHAVALRLAQDLPVRYLALSRNFGKEAALTAGLAHARGSAVLLIDADFQHPLELLPEMHALWLAGYDMVYGVIVDRGFESGTKRVGTGAVLPPDQHRQAGQGAAQRR